MSTLGQQVVGGGTGKRYAPLDGVRAVAVLLVVVHHAFTPNYDFGGLLGVDVFFVLSGYLITTLLLLEQQRFGGIGMGRFYARRFIRLYPPLLAMLAVLAIPGLLAAPSMKAFVLENFYAVTYTTPIALDIYGNAAWMQRHTWSLGIEEMFYLVWPAVLVVAARRGFSKHLTSLSLLVGMAMLGANALLGLIDVESKLLRAGGLLLGCALAAYLHSRPATRAGVGVGVAGAIVIAVSVAIVPLTPTHAFPALVTGIGTVAVVAHLVTTSGSWMSRMLAWRPAAYVGEISYEIYLWHYPLLVLGIWTFGGGLIDHAWWAVPVSLVAAAVSHALLAPLQERLKARFPRRPVQATT